MITFLANNWYWLLLVGAMVFMHAGHGGHGGGHNNAAGGHGGAAGGHCGGSAHQGHQGAPPQEADHDASAAGRPPAGSAPR